MTAQRLGLLLFGTAFVALFLVVAISEGVGDPSIPSGDVAVVEHAPGDLEAVTQDELERALGPAAAQAGVQGTPEPGDPRYEEVKKSAMFTILESIWIQGVAAEMGIEVTDREVEAEWENVRRQSFPTPKALERFRKQTRYTPEDLLERVTVQLLATKIQEQLSREAPKPTASEVEGYYEAAKGSRFLQPETRDLRLISSKDREKIAKARSELERDSSLQSWRRVAGRYSDTTSGGKGGGLIGEATQGSLGGGLDEAVFEAPVGQLEGPVEGRQGYSVFEVTAVTPESVEDLEAVESQIESTLETSLREEDFAEFVAQYNETWLSRTHCASDYLVERCGNFKGDGRPPDAPAACYEDDPRGGRPDACPAPVALPEPALPGSVTPLEPQGNRLPQRPRPVPSE